MEEEEGGVGKMHDLLTVDLVIGELVGGFANLFFELFFILGLAVENAVGHDDMKSLFLNLRIEKHFIHNTAY